MREAHRGRSNRDRELRRRLESERDRILTAIQLTIQAGREERAIEDATVQDRAELSEADAQGELEFSLLQMHGETLQQIEEALERLDAGSYGICVDCVAEIPSAPSSGAAIRDAVPDVRARARGAAPSPSAAGCDVEEDGPVVRLVHRTAAVKRSRSERDAELR